MSASLQLRLPFNPPRPLPAPNFPCHTWNEWDFLIECGYSEKELIKRIDADKAQMKRWIDERQAFQRNYFRGQK